jgi:fumarate reductase flavoprotein subunit
MQLNSRSFLKTSAVMTTGATAIFGSSSALAMPNIAPEKYTESYDVVIIGAGGAGLAAACEAVDKKLSVLVLESQAAVGGSSTICGGAYSAADTYLQREKGIKDSNELFVKDMLKTGGYMNDEALVRAFVKESKEHFDWLVKQGVKPNVVTSASGMSVPRAHGFKPSEVIQAMKNYAVKGGAKIMVNTAAERLLYCPKTNRIVGVKAVRKGKEMTFEGKKGVLLAAGGFSRNPDMLAKYAPPMKRASTIAGLGTNGSGIKMALAYGADMIDTAYIKATYGFKINPESIARDFSIIYYSGAIMVNSDGQRFVNESVSYKILGDRALEQKDGKSWLIFDEKMRKNASNGNNWDKVLWKPIDEGRTDLDWLFVGNTIEEAAKKAGLDPAKVKATVDRYNANVDKGNDPDFGRNSLSSGFGKPTKIENGPFYVFPSVPVMIGTYCGLKINTNCQVIDVFGDVIPGLWAAGELVGGVHGAAYMTGTAFAKAQSFGRLAIRSIAG